MAYSQNQLKKRYTYVPPPLSHPDLIVDIPLGETPESDPKYMENVRRLFK